jgi:hypothetical protein
MAEARLQDGARGRQASGQGAHGAKLARVAQWSGIESPPPNP